MLAWFLTLIPYQYLVVATSRALSTLASTSLEMCRCYRSRPLRYMCHQYISRPCQLIPHQPSVVATFPTLPSSIPRQPNVMSTFGPLSTHLHPSPRQPYVAATFRAHYAESLSVLRKILTLSASGPFSSLA